MLMPDPHTSLHRSAFCDLPARWPFYFGGRTYRKIGPGVAYDVAAGVNSAFEPQAVVIEPREVGPRPSWGEVDPATAYESLILRLSNSIPAAPNH